MSWLMNFYKSTVGMKAAMALSGLILSGFVLFHMLGNLQIFLGPEALDDYSKMLHAIPELLWGVRITLLACISLHMYSAVVLTLRSRAARPVAYVKKEHLAATYASRTIVVGGVILVLFILFHLMHLTIGNVHPNFIPGRVNQNMIAGFSSFPVTLVYVVANTALGLHLYHGVNALTRSLGLTNPRYTQIARKVATGYAGLVAGGNILIAVCTYLRIGIDA